MSDNVILNVGSGGDAIGADDIGGIKYQRNKIIFGADGISLGDVSPTNPLPVTISSGPNMVSGAIRFTGPVSDAVVVNPTSGKALNPTRLVMVTDNDMVGKLTFRMGCGTTATPPMGPGVLMSHPGMANARDFSVGDGRDPVGNGAANQALRITSTCDAGAVYDVNYEYYES